MAQANGKLRWLTTRLNSERDPSVKYSTLWPSRRDSPSAAIRAMPTSFGRAPESGRSGREDILIFALYSPNIRLRYAYEEPLSSCQKAVVVGCRGSGIIR